MAKFTGDWLGGWASLFANPSNPSSGLFVAGEDVVFL